MEADVSSRMLLEEATKRAILKIKQEKERNIPNSMPTNATQVSLTLTLTLIKILILTLLMLTGR